MNREAIEAIKNKITMDKWNCDFMMAMYRRTQAEMNAVYEEVLFQISHLSSSMSGKFINIYTQDGERYCSNEDYDSHEEAFENRDPLPTYIETVKIIRGDVQTQEPTVELLNELYEKSDDPTIQGNEFYLRGFKDRESYLSGWVDVMNSLPENRPLYRDSGLWQIRTDDMEDVICQQGANESFEKFIQRYYDEVVPR